MADDGPIRSVLRDRRFAIAVAAGIVSGVLSAGMFDPDPAFALWYNPYSVGLAFGLLIGGVLLGLRVASPGRAFVFIVLSELIWYAVLHLTVFFLDLIQSVGVRGSLQFGLAGLVSGALGAALLAGGAALLFPWFRRRPLLAGAVILGGAAGMLLWLMPYLGSRHFGVIPLFVAWQGAFAGCLAWGIVTAKAPIERGRIW